jgi:beta-N-acetylhexosaminidase
MDTGSEWVQQTLAKMSLDQKIAQMLMPNFRPQLKPESMEDILVPGLDPGGVFFFGGSSAEFKRSAEWLQARCAVPALITSDLESGAGRMIADCVTFPDLMGLAAAADLGLAREMGRATSAEAREHGVHWTLGPVTDVNANPYNPIDCTRTLGDDPDRVASFSRELIVGMQEEGIAACAKHFHGWDDRDQHVCTTINPLCLDDWLKHSGKPFAEAIRAGVKSVMIGHVALPCVDPGDPDDPLGPPPATLSRKIVTGLLRERMGFQGVIITDALEMGGLVSRASSREDLLVRVVNAGSDVLLFCLAREDFRIIKRAIEKGAIGIERIDNAVSHILALKEDLGFALGAGAARPKPLPANTKRADFEAAAESVARKSITLVRGIPGAVKLSAGDRVLTIHLRSHPEYNVDAFDGLLEKEGFKVTRKTEADSDLSWINDDFISGFKAILILWNMGPTWGTADIRPGGNYMRIPWFVRQRFPQCPMLHISFGYPYMSHDLPWAEYLLNAYSPDIHSQKAALDVILGRESARGQSPVDLSRPRRFVELLVKETTKDFSF